MRKLLDFFVIGLPAIVGGAFINWRIGVDGPLEGLSWGWVGGIWTMAFFIFIGSPYWDRRHK